MKKILAWILFPVFLFWMIYLAITYSDDYIFISIGIFGLLSTLPYLIHLYRNNQSLKKLSRVAWFIILPVFTVGICSTTFFNIPWLDIVFSLISVLFLVISLIFFVTFRKIDTSILTLMVISFIGLIFKSKHFAGASFLMILGWVLPTFLFFSIIHQKITEYDSRSNAFLCFFRNYLCIVFSINFLGGTFKFMHWPGGDVLQFIGLPLLVLSVFMMVFLLPVSNFIEWTQDHRQMFYKAILVPLIYLSILASLVQIFPDTWNGLFSRYGKITEAFNMERYEIPIKDGL